MVLNLIVVRWAMVAVAVFAVTISIFGAGSAIAQAPLNGQTPVATLVKRLGSEDFVERQRASKLLFEKGAAIVPELQAVPLSSNPEVNLRVADLVKLLSVGRTAVENKETFDAIINFENAEFETRKQLLEKLLSGEQYAMYFHMIEKMPADQAEDIFNENRLKHLIPVLCEKQRWDAIDAILSHPLTWKYEPNLCGLYHKTMGTLDLYIDKLKREIDDSEFADAKQLATLIGFLKAEKRYDAALRYAKRFSNNDVVLAYENQILMAAGNWKALADRAVLGDAPIESDSYFICNRMTYPMIKYWGGSEDDFKKAVERVAEESVITKEDKQGDQDGAEEVEFVVDPILHQINMLTLNWEEARKGLKFAEDESTAQLLSVVNKYQLMLEELNLGRDFASHQKWARRKQAEIKKLTDKYFTGRVRRDRKEKVKEVNVAISYYLYICDLYAELGLEHEAILFVRQLYDQLYPISELLTNRLDLIGRVADYGDAEALWDFIENAGLNHEQLRWLVDKPRPLANPRGSQDELFVLFGLKHDVAQFVYQKLSARIEDPIKLLKRVAHIINYQLKPADLSSPNNPADADQPFRLDAEVALIEHSFGSDECWKISQIYAYHQRPEAKQWRARAAINGDGRAIKQIAREMFDQQDYVGAAAMFEQEYERTKNPLPLSLAALSHGLAGDRLKEKRLTFQAYVLPDFIYDNNFAETYVAYMDEERTDLIADRLFYRISTGSISSQSLLSGLGWQVLEESDPVTAANFAKIRLLTIAGAVEPVQLLSLSASAHTLDATAAVVAGDYERADRILKRLLDFSPATPSVAETTVVELDRAGETARADAVVGRLKDYYHQLLAEYPTSSMHCNNYAWTLACAKRHAGAAVRHAQTAVARRPNSPGFIDTLAESHFAAGDIDKAVEVINHAASIEPEKAYYKNQRRKYEAARGNQ